MDQYLVSRYKFQEDNETLKTIGRGLVSLVVVPFYLAALLIKGICNNQDSEERTIRLSELER
ncbi:MAG: hypothetical protein AABX66_00815 [Nanoarchaeota archaeon]